MIRELLILCALLLTTLGTSSLAAPASTATSAKNRNFVFRLAGEPETLDWNRAHTPIETYILMNLMEGLVSFDDDMKVVPALAKSWSVSKDGKIYTFKLRPGVVWSDGVALRAQDFVYSWKRLLSPLTAAAYAYFLFDVVGAEDFNRGKIKDFSQVGVKAPDDETLVIQLSKPLAHWIQIPTFWVTFPLRQDLVEKHGEGWDKPGRMATVGPFVLTTHDIDSKIVMKANPKYYGKHGNIDQAIGLIIKDSSTALTLYETGKVDFVTDLATVDLERLRGRSDLRIFSYYKTGYLGFSTNQYPANTKEFRRAVAMAIDKRRIGDILHGGQTLAGSLVPPGILGYSNGIGLPYDPPTARSMLRQAGVDAPGTLKLEMLTVNWEKNLTLCQFIQEELRKNLGLNVAIRSFDHKTFRAELDLHTAALWTGSWSADYPDPDNFLSVYLSDSGNNRTTWKNSIFDEMVVKARYMTGSASKIKARERAYLDAQRLLVEDHSVVVPLFYEPNPALVKARVKGLVLNPLNYLLLRKVTLGS